MKKLNDFLMMVNKKDKKYRISLCGHWEAVVGNYFLYGVGMEEYGLLYIPVNFSVKRLVDVLISE